MASHFLSELPTEPNLDIVDRDVVNRSVQHDRALMQTIADAYSNSQDFGDTYESAHSSHMATADTNVLAMLEEQYHAELSHTEHLNINWNQATGIPKVASVVLTVMGLLVSRALREYPQPTNREGTLLHQSYGYASLFLADSWMFFFGHYDIGFKYLDAREEALGKAAFDRSYKVAMGILFVAYNNYCRGWHLPTGLDDRVGVANITEVNRFIQMNALLADSVQLRRHLRWIYDCVRAGDKSSANEILDLLSTSPTFNNRSDVWTVCWADKATLDLPTWLLGVDRLSRFGYAFSRHNDNDIGEHRELHGERSGMSLVWMMISMLVLQRSNSPPHLVEHAWRYQDPQSIELAWTMIKGATIQIRETLLMAVERWAST